MHKLSFVRITSGELHQHLKDIDIVGRIDEDGEFRVFGCKNEDQDRFYKGILEYDKETQIQGWETVVEVKEWWEEEADMILCVDKGDYEVVDTPAEYEDICQES
jgi:hypothetical protein